MKRSVSSICDGQAIFKATILIVIYHPFNYQLFTYSNSEDGTSSLLVSLDTDSNSPLHRISEKIHSSGTELGFGSSPYFTHHSHFILHFSHTYSLLLLADPHNSPTRFPATHFPTTPRTCATPSTLLHVFFTSNPPSPSIATIFSHTDPCPLA